MFTKYNIFFWILHVLISVASIASPQFIIVWYGTTLFLSIWVLLRKKNISLNLTVFLLYFSGMEMAIKLQNVGLPHEVIKYTCIMLMFLAIIKDKTKTLKIWPIVFILLLLLSIPFGFGEVEAERYRQLISANLSGPFLLLLGLFYYFRVHIFDKDSISNILLSFILPSLVTTILLFVVTPDVKTISFSTNANFSASGYGPNQMSSSLGIAASFIVFSLLYNFKITPSKLISFFLIGIISYRIILTFSRGGLFTLILLSIAIIFIYLKNSELKIKKRMWIISLFTFSLTLGGMYLYNKVNLISDGALQERIFGEREFNNMEEVNDYSSGRSEIFLADLEIFNDNILGIGPGIGYYSRKEYGYQVNVSAHIEYTRLLAEHGIFGLVVLFGLLKHALTVLKQKVNAENKALIIILLGTSMLFMSHSATRIAAPMVLFSLTAVFLSKDKVSLTPIQGNINFAKKFIQ